MASTDSTRDRIVAAARAEFARYGIAGARVDRIAKAARSSKERVYAYFRSKEELYAFVAARELVVAAEAIHLDPRDLPTYAGQMFDHFTAHPDRHRFIAWGRLELPPDTKPAGTDPLGAEQPFLAPTDTRPADTDPAEPSAIAESAGAGPARGQSAKAGGQSVEAGGQSVEGRSGGRGLSPYRRAILGKIEKIRRAQQAGDLDPSWDPVDIMALISQIANTWADQSEITSLAPQAAADPTLAARRAAVVRAVSVLFPPTQRPGTTA
ncbi:TetR family transcriptional regulator [Nonomuraea sp. NPDC050404]|uniref:TetR family transcriptional regulator n=1 Tax=Nonomuraea sp. NPDC050404 TaxID=3155783 RepID=UPI0033D84D8A